ncbi:response regulator [Halorubrum tibetense]|uniref:Response regulator n=1 Tax=Halorubrum tibetense TaxID=175631 RepID=A0ABD5SAJ8_9EURY
MHAPADGDGVDSESRIRVLHVDDDEAFGDLVSTYLERIDDAFEVRSEPDGETALAALDSTTFDCVVSDYDMPGVSGLELLDRIRERDSELPFVLFTGKGSEEIASDAIAAGATDYLQKAGGADQYTVLANRVRNAVDQYRSKRALAASQERLSRFIEQSPLGTIEYDEGFRIVRANPAAEEILGYDAETLVEGTWMPFVPTDQRRAVAAIERELLANRGGYRSVNENVTADGDRILCAWHNQVVTDDDGEVIRVFSQFEDITDRERRKRAVERTNAVLSSVFDTLPHGVLVEDADRYVLAANDRLLDLFDVDAASTDVTGTDCVAFAREVSDRFRDSDAFLAGIDRVIDAAEPVRGERLPLADEGALLRSYRPIDLPEGRGHLWLYQDADRQA